MTKKTKIWLVTATSLVILGSIIFAIIMMQLEWDFTKLSTTQYETNEYEVSDFFENISISTTTADIELICDDNQQSVVVCYEDEKEKHTVTVKDNTLLIEVADDKQWYEHIGVDFRSPKISVYVPESEYDSLSIKNSTGNVYLNNVTASEKISVKTSTGNVDLLNCDGSEIFIQTDTGNVKGNLLSEKTFVAHTDTGRISVPKTQSSEKCEITTDTGNIKITVEQK